MSHEACPGNDRERAATNKSRKTVASITSRGANSASSDYYGVVLSSAADIRGLKDAAKRLMPTEDTTLSPEFFLASLSKGWRPKVVAVRREQKVVGILYAKERTIKGIPTGIVYADGSLGGIFLADSLFHRRAFRAGAEALLASPGTRSLRLRVLRSSRDFDAVLQLSSSLSHEVRYFPIENPSSLLWKNHAHLALAGTYEKFLKTLGNLTRRNFRYYRRRFEASGHRFVEHLSINELHSAALRLSPKSKLTARAQHMNIDWQLNRVAAASRPLAVGLKHRDGEWLSVLGGCYMPGAALLSFQYNNEENFTHDSLSVVLRGYLIERLIQQGLKELVIWSDTGPPLSRYVTYAHTIEVRVDVTARSWRMVRSIVSAIEPHLPNRLAAAAHWIVG